MLSKRVHVLVFYPLLPCLVPREWRKLYDEEFSLLSNVKWRSDSLSSTYKVQFFKLLSKEGTVTLLNCRFTILKGSILWRWTGMNWMLLLSGNVVEEYWRFRVVCCLYHQGDHLWWQGGKSNCRFTGSTVCGAKSQIQSWKPNFAWNELSFRWIKNV